MAVVEDGLLGHGAGPWRKSPIIAGCAGEKEWDARDSGLGTRDSGLGTRDSGLGTRDSGLGTRDGRMMSRGKSLSSDLMQKGPIF
ncbi:hypothetical protein F0H33_13990 [Xanthomonas translucens pv. undulosa]|nr:hypothetical protein F0H33_13990 [Xanthomonas translucens pv. undulosa]QEO27160.1 hypothetical protein F0H32_13970 [Xanthomonas translucens pv. undulosa]